MGLENLFQGLQMFQQGLKEYSTSKAIGEATEAVNQLNQSEVSDQQKRVAQTRLGNQLALHLGQLGAPVSQIQSATGAIKPEQYGSPEEMMMKGMLEGRQDLTKQGQEISAMMNKPKLEAEERAYKRQVGLQDRKFNQELQLEMMKARAKGRDLKQLNDAHIDKITSLENVPNMLSSLADRLDSEDIGIGPISGRNPVRSFMPDTAAFDADLGRIKAEYRKSVTGAGMSDTEREDLNKNFPSTTDTADVFRAKIEKLNYYANLEKTNLLKNLARGSRDVSAYTQAEQTASPVQQQAGEAVIGNVVYKRVKGGWVPK